MHKSGADYRLAHAIDTNITAIGWTDKTIKAALISPIKTNRA